jgi:hypothetical protein
MEGRGDPGEEANSRVLCHCPAIAGRQVQRETDGGLIGKNMIHPSKGAADFSRSMIRGGRRFVKSAALVWSSICARKIHCQDRTSRNQVGASPAIQAILALECREAKQTMLAPTANWLDHFQSTEKKRPGVVWCKLFSINYLRRRIIAA